MPSPQSTQNDDQQSALEQFGINLTDRARQGKLDPVIGRDSETVSYTHLTLPTICSV